MYTAVVPIMYDVYFMYTNIYDFNVIGTINGDTAAISTRFCFPPVVRPNELGSST